MTRDIDSSLVERFHRAFVANDAAALDEVLGDDVELHMTGRSPFAGSHRGKDAVIAVVRRMHELSGGTLRPLRDDSHDIMISEYHAMLTDRFLAERGDKRLDTHVGFIVVTEGGKVKLLLPYFYDQYAFDEFWA
ncbi:MAG: nuclear transport factor 2 family protein [Dehalococcoidia bacterium]|nr:nuclear transport factor 2 family protein [Dehalococcoidia bacterium]